MPGRPNLKMKPDSPTLLIRNLHPRVKAAICEAVESHGGQSTSKVAEWVLLAVEDHLPELIHIGRQKDSILRQGFNVPKEVEESIETHTRVVVGKVKK